VLDLQLLLDRQTWAHGSARVVQPFLTRNAHRRRVQVQGLMEIFGREWCNLFVWTVNGSCIYHLRRDRDYWAACFELLSEFWWAHVVPAKIARDAGDLAAVRALRWETQFGWGGILGARWIDRSSS
jgi:hypothetical protein